MKKILFLIVFPGTVIVSNAQTMSCCAKPTVDGMVAFADDPKFKESHASPLPFTYVEQAGKMITFPTDDGKTGSAYFIMAKKPTNNYLIVTHEWWGLNDYIKKHSDELQKELDSVNVIAVDMYDGKVATNADSAGKYMKGAKDARIKSILKGAITYAGPNANIITLGWCFGGGYSLQAAILAGKQAKACVMYYGMPEKDTARLRTLNCPVLGLFGTKDAWITPEIVKTFQDNMKAVGKTLTVNSYDANHGFANPSSPSYDNLSAKEANMVAFLFIRDSLK